MFGKSAFRGSPNAPSAASWRLLIRFAQTAVTTKAKKSLKWRLNSLFEGRGGCSSCLLYTSWSEDSCKCILPIRPASCFQWPDSPSGHWRRLGAFAINRKGPPQEMRFFSWFRTAFLFARDWNCQSSSRLVFAIGGKKAVFESENSWKTGEKTAFLAVFSWKKTDFSPY